MKEHHKAHLTKWSPAYIISVILAGGGGTAALTDNLPVTQGQMVIHESVPHQSATDAIVAINTSLKAIQLEQTREGLTAAHLDKCTANGDGLDYIEKEIDRLEAIYYKLTEREYDPRPCPESEDVA